MIVLKKIQHNERMSEDSNCFSADIWFKGKRIGSIFNQGFGGCDVIDGDKAGLAEAETWCAENLPHWDCNGTQEPMDLSLHCNDLLEIHLKQKDLKKIMTNGVVILDDEGKLATYSWKGVRKVTQQHVEKISQKHPGKVLNAMPFEDAMAIYNNSH